jgi:uncharacterized membrane-anchored protein YhcB (DUF1043 family)
MQRTTVAYLIIVMMVAGLSAGMIYLRYHSRERSYRRRLKREHAEYKRQMAARGHE